MGIVQHPDPSVNLHAPAPDAWAIRDVGTLAQARRLYDAGCRVSRHVLSRRCAQCQQWGNVVVCKPDELAEAVDFITTPGWRCNLCRRADTAHLCPSPRPMPAGRRAAPPGSVGKNPRRRNTQAVNATRRQKAIDAAWALYHDAQATLDGIERGDIPATATANARKQRNKAWHALVRYGVVRGQEVA